MECLAGVTVAALALLGASAPTVATTLPKSAVLNGAHHFKRATASSALAACSKAEARALIDQHSLNGFLLPPAEVLCGPFTGPGTAVAVAAGNCWGVQEWAVFSFIGGTWKLALEQGGYIVLPLVAVGADIKETTAVLPRD